MPVPKPHRYYSSSAIDLVWNLYARCINRRQFMGQIKYNILILFENIYLSLESLIKWERLWTGVCFIFVLCHCINNSLVTVRKLHIILVTRKRCFSLQMILHFECRLSGVFFYKNSVTIIFYVLVLRYYFNELKFNWNLEIGNFWFLLKFLPKINNHFYFLH